TIVMWVVLLSSAILPPWPVFVTLAGVIIAVATLMWNSFLRVYARAHGAIRETLTHTPELHEPQEPRPVPTLLHDSVLETITLAAGRNSSTTTITAPRLLVPIKRIVANMHRNIVSHRLVLLPAASVTAGACASSSHRRHRMAQTAPAASRIGAAISISRGVMV